MKPVAPCLKCTDRTEGCHSKCIKYVEFRKNLDIVNEIEQRKKNTLQVFYSRKRGR